VETQSFAVTIRAAVAEDADGIARAFLESAEHHARLDAERYSVPEFEVISVHYRNERQHLPGTVGITLVAELAGEIVGFVDARLEHSPDPMHCNVTYCQVAEIAVTARRQGRGIGRRLLRAAEDWGRRQGAQFASLEYLAANTRAGAFYHLRMGYSVASLIAVKRL
jgi:GNAT superfamily N-acetyltransferase